MINLPNKLTILRIILIPVILILLLPVYSGKMLLPYSVEVSRTAAAVIFVLAALTDMLDGAIARKRNCVTTFGKFLDPIADKLLVISSLIALVQLGEVSAWAVVIIIAREFIVTGIRILAANDGVVIAASGPAKIKTFSQMAAILLILINNFPFSLFIDVPIGQILLWIAVILTIYSGYYYLKANKDRIKG
jgi:CDP-diacylglycerol--glycerol-3-phosphate 3-phosphatidyltransferase